MLRCVARAHVRTSPRPLRRYFNSTSSRYAGSRHLFDDLLLNVHAVTALPWLVTIPLTFVLVRSLFIPFRIRQASREKEQHLLMPKLKVLRAIVEQQNSLRVAAGIHRPEDAHEWKHGEFEKRKAELEKENRCMKISPWDIGDATSTRLSVASVGSAFVFAESICSVDRLADTYPVLIEPEIFDGMLGLMPFAFCSAFAVLSCTNMSYYLNIKQADGDEPKKGVLNILFAGGPEHSSSIMLAVAGLTAFLFEMPGAVIITAFSHSAYTFAERKIIRLVLDMPKSDSSYGQRRAVQVTKKWDWSRK